MSRKTVLLIVFILLVGGGYAAVRFLWGLGGVPQAFTDARLKGALISQNIVNLSNESTLDLVKINEYEVRGNYTEALNLTTDVIKRSQEIRDQAVELSKRVEEMTRSLSDLDMLDARQAALESISNRLALLSRLINYSGYLGQLLDTLRSNFAGKTYDGKTVSFLIDQINSEVRAINSFNNQAGQAMDRFDKIVNK